VNYLKYYTIILYFFQKFYSKNKDRFLKDHEITIFYYFKNVTTKGLLQLNNSNKLKRYAQIL